MVEEERDGKRYQKMVDGGQIELSNFKTSGHGVHGRVGISLLCVSMFTLTTSRSHISHSCIFTGNMIQLEL